VAWHPAETKLRCARSLQIYMPNSKFTAFIDHSVHTDGLADGHG